MNEEQLSTISTETAEQANAMMKKINEIKALMKYDLVRLSSKEDMKEKIMTIFTDTIERLDVTKRIIENLVIEGSQTDLPE